MSMQVYVANVDSNKKPINELVGALCLHKKLTAVDIGSKEVKIIIRNPADNSCEVFNFKSFINQEDFSGFKTAHTTLVNDKERDITHAKKFYEELLNACISLKAAGQEEFAHFSAETFKTNATIVQGGGKFKLEPKDIKAGKKAKHDLSDQADSEWKMVFTCEDPVTSAYNRTKIATDTKAFSQYLDLIAPDQPIIIATGALAAALIPLRERNQSFVIDKVEARLYNAAMLFQLFGIEAIKATTKEEKEKEIEEKIGKLADNIASFVADQGEASGPRKRSGDDLLLERLDEILGISPHKLKTADKIKSAIERAASNYLHRTVLKKIQSIAATCREKFKLPASDYTCEFIHFGPGSSNPTFNAVFRNKSRSNDYIAIAFVLPGEECKKVLSDTAQVNAEILDLAICNALDDNKNWKRIANESATYQSLIEPLIESMMAARHEINASQPAHSPASGKTILTESMEQKFERPGSKKKSKKSTSCFFRCTKGDPEDDAAAPDNSPENSAERGVARHTTKNRAFNVGDTKC